VFGACQAPLWGNEPQVLDAFISRLKQRIYIDGTVPVPKFLVVMSFCVLGCLALRGGVVQSPCSGP